MREYTRHTQKRTRSNASYVGGDSQMAALAPPVQYKEDHDHHVKDFAEEDRMTKGTFRFRGDKELEKIEAGTLTLKNYSEGLPVTKLQQALVDLGYDVGKHGVDGKFGDDTETALKKFQFDAGVAESGEFNKATLQALKTEFAHRKPYLDEATFDSAKPKEGLRDLSWKDRKAVHEALVPARGTGGSSATFKEEVAGKKYGDEIKKQLTSEIARLHKTLYADKKGLRADPKKNFHDWSVLEGTAKASKEVTDSVYGSYAKGPEIKNKRTDPITGAVSEGNLIDQWEDELKRNSALDKAGKKNKATEKVWYLIASNCTKINKRHSAVPTDTKEKAILLPIVKSFVDTEAKVQTMLELDIGWEGAQLEGTIYLQRYKQDTDKKNVEQLWELFHVCIHEYIHSLAHDDYKSYAATLDKVRYNTLIEGFCDFFTENVRQSLKINDKIQKQVEGPYYKKGRKIPDDIRAGVYSSIVQAERVVAIVGTRNAQAAYFQGKTKYMRGT